MKTPRLTLVVVTLALLPAATSWAGGFGFSAAGSSASTGAKAANATGNPFGRGGTWRDRFRDEIFRRYSKPATGQFAKPYEARPAFRATVVRPAPPTVTAPAIQQQTRLATAEHRTPWYTTGGFGSLIRRAVSNIRVSWETRFGHLRTATPEAVASAHPMKKARGVHAGSQGSRKLFRVKVARSSYRPARLPARHAVHFRATVTRTAVH